MANTDNQSTSKKPSILTNAKTLMNAPTNEKVMPALKKTGLNIGISVLGGGLLAALIGKPSFLLGAGLAFTGYYKDNPFLAPLGIGMMASTHIAPNNPKVGVDGKKLEQEKENIKERFTSIKDSWMSKTYLDKVFKKGSSKNSRTTTTDQENVNGFGTVSDNLTALDRVEQQLISSALKTQTPSRTMNMNGFEDKVANSSEDMGEVDFSSF
jgi:hypothetical protein